MFKGAKLSQDLSVAKSYFECSNFGFQVQCTQLLTTKKKKKKSSNFDVVTGLLSTAWTDVLSQIETHTFPG